MYKDSNEIQFVFIRYLKMASMTLTLTGKSSQLSAKYFPEIDLNDGDYVCGLIDFHTFNTIPNVDNSNNLFYYGNGGSQQLNRKKRSVAIDSNDEELRTTCITIPVGSYEVADLNRFLKKKMQEKNVTMELEANKNTLQCEIMCNQSIDFSKPNTIGPLLGFTQKQVLEKNKAHISNAPADILKVNVIRVECNIIKGSYLNDKPSHTIHEFSPRVPPGYKVVEVPQNVIYFPITVKSIHDLTLSITDQDNNLVDFRGERITVRLHIKKVE